MMNFMLNRMNCFAIGMMLIMAGSCKTSKNTVAENKTESTMTTDSKTNAVEKTYRVIVSFISIGGGSDSQAYAKLNDIISRTQESGGMLSKDEIPWGREGEVDVCLPLTELSKQQADALVQQLKKTFEGNNLVQITENSPALHKARPAFKGE